MNRAFLLLPLLATTGCVSTAKSIVTAPFKVVGKAADWATTSQSEADRNRGKKIRKAEEQARKDCKRQADGDMAREECVKQKLRDGGLS
ncbi:Lipoprotein [Sphingomonas antarctica]|uniref:hypothetical protein n=1 Tax=Sphingomonas antarctica TaxID=2040274 RepID=UPI0039EC8962